MIERCKYCELEHDTGEENITFGGVPMKSCPMITDKDTIYLLAHSPYPLSDPEWPDIIE